MENLTINTTLNFVDKYTVLNRTGEFKVVSLGVSRFEGTQDAQSINLLLIGSEPSVYININDASQLTKIVV
jgi:hypothetical protein